MKIGSREIGNYRLPYVVAEISCNHLGKLKNAFELIAAAKRAGADAVKFQAYTPDTITINCKKPDFIIQDGLWRHRTLYELYAEAYTPFEWFPALFERARKEDIVAFASVFDPSSVEMLEKLGCPAYKIASFEIVDIPLIRLVTQTGKPVIISTGMANSAEVLDAKNAADGGAAFLHCTSDYPARVEEADLDRMRRLGELLGDKTIIGISDHSVDDLVPIAATALGAAIIEKHLKLPEDNKSEDAQFSLTPAGFGRMVERVRQTHEALKLRIMKGNPSYQMRRSLYVVEDIKAGEPLTEKNVRSIRPGYGMAPKHLTKMLGRKADKDYRRGDRL